MKSPARKWWLWDLNPGSLAPVCVILTTHDTAPERTNYFRQLIFLVAKVNKKNSQFYIYSFVFLTREIISCGI